MEKSYEDNLLDKSISIEDMVNLYKPPTYLYKYQNFYSDKGEENKYWRENLRGAFHLSLASEFADQNDCRPYIDPDGVNIILPYMMAKFNMPEEEIPEFRAGCKKRYTQEFINNVVSMYQSEKRVGCLTRSADNQKLWEKYANNETGFCIEYETCKSVVLESSILPILYRKFAYDATRGYADALIYESILLLSLLESSEEKSSIFVKRITDYLTKFAYIFIFIKDERKWSFEEEYRLFIFNHELVKNEENSFDENGNISLSMAITAIYLGKNFRNNKNHESLREEIDSIAKEMGIKVIQM